MTNEHSTRDRFEAHLTPLLSQAFGLAFRLTNGRDDAEDLLQDAALRAFNSFHQFQPDTNFKAWFLRVLVTTFLNAKRKHLASPQIAPLDEGEEIDDQYIWKHATQSGAMSRKTDPAQLLMQRVESEEVAAALAALPEEFRVVALLSFLEQRSYEEIAEIVDCPVGTVRSRLHRSRKLLQKALWQLALEKGIVTEQR